MSAIPQIKGWTIPEEIKIVNKNRAVHWTNRLEPCVEAENPAKTTDASAKWRDGTGDKDPLATVIKRVKEPAKVPF